VVRRSSTSAASAASRTASWFSDSADAVWTMLSLDRAGGGLLLHQGCGGAMQNIDCCISAPFFYALLTGPLQYLGRNGVVTALWSTAGALAASGPGARSAPTFTASGVSGNSAMSCAV